MPLMRSLDIFGHWNAKRSSVPYLTYWALDVGLACFRDGVSLIGGHGRRQWAGRTVGFGGLQKNQSNSLQADETRLLLSRRESVSENSIRCAWVSIN
ncbi:hypothetical protein TNCV_2445381 [Trichonephila clavipes]|nr:hypothetical protein TNCV_2445381 [Trichonephila clavipes]